MPDHTHHTRTHSLAEVRVRSREQRAGAHEFYLSRGFVIEKRQLVFSKRR